MEPPTHRLGHGELHYPGDVRDGVVGRVMGPTTYGAYLYVFGADYDAATDRTTAHLRPATQADIDKARAA